MPPAASGYRDSSHRDSSPAAGWTALGAAVQLVVTDPARLEPGRALLESELADMDAACNSQRPDSEIAGLEGGGDPARVSPLLADALGIALHVARLTDGDVDPVAEDAFDVATGTGYGITEALDGDAAGYGAAVRAAGQAYGAAVRTSREAQETTTRTAGSPAGADGAASGGTVAGGDAAVLLAAPSGAWLELLTTPAPGWRQIRLESGPSRLWLPAGVRLDLSATVKAWAVDRCAAQLADSLGCGVLVGLGGDIAVAGEAPPGGWRIRIAGVRADEQSGPATVVAIHDGGLATASTAVRRRQRSSDLLQHILDPRAGMPAAPFWRAVSVAASSCVSASAASAAAMIRGRHALDWLRSVGLPSRLVSLDGRVHTIAGWPANR